MGNGTGVVSAQRRVYINGQQESLIMFWVAGLSSHNGLTESEVKLEILSGLAHVR